MKRTFEFILVLIIFYGIYELFYRGSAYFFDTLDQAWVVIASLVFSFLLLFIYKLTLTADVKNKMKGEIHDLHNALKEKDHVIKKAKTFKEDLIKEAEESEKVE